MVTHSVPSILMLPSLSEPSSPASGQETLPPLGKAHGCWGAGGAVPGLLTDRRAQRGALFAGKCTVLGPDERI